MKLKTALELLGDDIHHASIESVIELVAKRAREDAFEIAARMAFDLGADILVVKAIRALPTEPAINQCDGCRAGHPVSDGIHRPAGSKPWDGQAMACTRDRYEGPQGDDWEVGIDNDDRD